MGQTKYHYESVEERVRNAVGPMWNIAEVIKDLQNSNVDLKIKNALYKYVINDSDLSNRIRNSIEYLINIANCVDKYLPKDFSINEHIEYEGLR